MKIALPPGCMALQAPSGHVYADKARADRTIQPRLGAVSKRRDRSVEVTDPRELAMIKDNVYLNTPGIYFAGDGWDCPKCHFGCWGWAQVCSRCGTEKKESSNA